MLSNPLGWYKHESRDRTACTYDPRSRVLALVRTAATSDSLTEHLCFWPVYSAITRQAGPLKWQIWSGDIWPSNHSSCEVNIAQRSHCSARLAKQLELQFNNFRRCIYVHLLHLLFIAFIIYCIYVYLRCIYFYTLSGRTRSELGWHSEGRTILTGCSKSCDL